jgi:predicted Zn-dependent peptidase
MRADRTRIPEVGADPVFTFPAIARHTLPNGVAVRTVEHHNAPVVTIVIQCEGGSGADPSGQEGLSALTADMVDEGTGPLTAIDVSDALARIGGEYDVEVGADVTTFTLTTLTRFADRGAALLADIVARPSLRQTDFDRVHQLRLDRLRQLKDLPPAMAERAFLRLLYGDHPYGHLPIGDEPSLQGLRVRDVETFHQASYRPSGATVVVAGPMAHGELLDVAARALSSWREPGQQDQALTVAAAIDPPAAVKFRLSIVPRDGAAQSEVRIGYLSARRSTADYPALLVMNAIMGGQFVSRINLKLREEKGYTYGARTGFDWRRGLSPFTLQASVHTASTADAVRDSLHELEAIRHARPPSDAELSLAKASLTRGYPRNFETVQQVARSVAQLALFNLPDTYFEEFVPKVHRITQADVVDAAERYIDSSKLGTLVVGDVTAVRDGLGALGLGEPQILST